MPLGKLLHWSEPCLAPWENRGKQLYFKTVVRITDTYVMHHTVSGI